MSNASNKNRVYKDGKTFWGVIKTMMEELKIEQEKQKFIPEDLNLKVGYKMDDIDFNHTVIIEEGNILAKEGILDDADVVIKVSSQMFHDMNIGKISSMQALTSSLFEVEKGDMGKVLLAGTMPTMIYYRKACEIHCIK